MTARKGPWRGLLLKPIDLADAPARGLRLALGADPDATDLFDYAKNQLDARFTEFDGLFGLSSASKNIWEDRAKALVEREFGISPNDPQWWGRFGLLLMLRDVPGIALKKANQKRQGAPRQWTFDILAQLFADVEFLKKKTRKPANAICNVLPRTKGYTERWGHYRGSQQTALRKAYGVAKRLLRQNVLFALHLCGPNALKDEKTTDRVQCAIELHALKI